jgi:hypothetical protein
MEDIGMTKKTQTKKTQPKRKPGRESRFTKVIAEKIINDLCDGVPLRAICRKDGMPAWRTVYDWLDRYPNFAAAIARARDLGEIALAEQCLDIADDEQHDWVLTKKGVVLNEVAVGRAKLQIDTRLKLLAKFNPKKWGDSSKVEVSGKVKIEEMTEEEIRAELAALIAQGFDPSAVSKNSDA